MKSSNKDKTPIRSTHSFNGYRKKRKKEDKEARQGAAK
jgi:hypothetical protein